MVTLHIGGVKNTDEALQSTKKWSFGIALEYI